MVVEEARRQGVNPQLALSIAFAESGFNPKSISPAGAIGIMQLMPAKAKELEVNPHDPEQNIEGGIRLLKILNDQFQGDPLKVVVAYNAGENKDFFKTGDLDNLKDETLEYVTKIAGYNDGQIPPVLMERVSETVSPNEVTTQEKVSVEEPLSKPSLFSAGSTSPDAKMAADIERHTGRVVGGVPGLVAGATLQAAGALGNRFRGAPSAQVPASATPTSPQARPGPVRPPLGGTGTQNYARAFGLGDIEAGRAVDMTKQPGGVHDLTTQRRTGLQRVNELFPNQFREDPRFGGLMTPEERPGAGPRGPTGQIGGGKPPPIVKPPGPLQQVTQVFQNMASQYPKAARGISSFAQRVPVVSYPLAGANIGGETLSAYQDFTKENPDYYGGVLKSLGALGTGLSMFPASAPFGIPLMTIPPLIQYYRENPSTVEPDVVSP